MGEDIRTLRTRIKNVRNTLDMTTAMGLMAASRRPRSMRSLLRVREYDEGIGRAIVPLLSDLDCQKSRYFRADLEKPCCLVAISADRGMAGGFDASIFKALREYEDMPILPIGKRICERYEKMAVRAQDFDIARAKNMAEELCRDFVAGQYSRVEILYTHYESAFVHHVEKRRILPLEAGERSEQRLAIFEPDAEAVLSHIVPLYVAGALLRAVRESVASEIAARTQAMDIATKNASAMLDEMHLALGRARQSAITQEISEIVASIEP